MRVVVIKVGGALLDAPATIDALLEQIKQLQADTRVVLVHGGGALTEKLLTQLGFVSKKINGLRVTPAEHIPIVAGTLAGTANKLLCARAHAVGVNAVGLSLLDGNMVTCTSLGEEYGSVGVPSPQHSKLLDTLLDENYLPVVSSIGSDDNGNLLNVNADHAATALAELIDAQLVMLSDVPGVLDKNGDLFPSLNKAQIDQLTQQEVIHGGMCVKVNAAYQAALTLARPVMIGGWSNPLAAILDADSGTQIFPDTDMEY